MQLSSKDIDEARAVEISQPPRAAWSAPPPADTKLVNQRHSPEVRVSQLKQGLRLERRYLIDDAMTAAALMAREAPDAGALPEVWSTPDMIGKMEVVCAALAAPLLPAGQITVGSRNEISHLKPTPVPQHVRVQSTLQSIDGRKLTFAVQAFDATELVGEGIHVRFIVDRARFETTVKSKLTVSVD